MKSQPQESTRLKAKLEQLNEMIATERHILRVLEIHPTDPSVQASLLKRKRALQQALDRKRQIRQQIIDQMEAPLLRDQLFECVAKLETAQQTIDQLQSHITDLEQTHQTLTTQLKNLDSLCKSMTEQVALLSLHESQNKDNHAFAVMHISEALKDLGFYDMIARPSRARLTLEDPIAEPANSDEVENPYIDQTIFIKVIQHQRTKITLSILVNAIHPDQHPIEILEVIHKGGQPIQKATVGQFKLLDIDEVPTAFKSRYEQHIQELGLDR